MTSQVGGALVGEGTGSRTCRDLRPWRHR